MRVETWVAQAEQAIVPATVIRLRLELETSGLPMKEGMSMIPAPMLKGGAVTPTRSAANSRRVPNRFIDDSCPAAQPGNDSQAPINRPLKRAPPTGKKKQTAPSSEPSFVSLANL